MATEDNSRTDEPNRQMLIYQSPENTVRIEVRLEGETVWLTQQQMAELFQSSRSNIVEHIGNIYAEGELDEEVTCRDFRQVRREGSRNVARTLPHYNLDMIISLGYRVKSKTATQFRRWATERLKEYLIKGFTLDEERLKNLGGGSYWYELLERIRDICSSEKVMYRQVLDLYATMLTMTRRTRNRSLFSRWFRTSCITLPTDTQWRKSFIAEPMLPNLSWLNDFQGQSAYSCRDQGGQELFDGRRIKGAKSSSFWLLRFC